MIEVMEEPQLLAETTLGQLPRSLHRIVEGASSWQESAPYMTPGAATASPEAQALMARWKKLLTLGGGEEAFTRRLQQLGWTAEEALDHLVPASLPEDTPAPEWATVLCEVFRLARAEDDDAEADLAYASGLSHSVIARQQLQVTTPGQEWVVFEALLRPFVAWTLRTLKQHSAWQRSLGEDAREEIAGALLGRLSWHCTRTIAYEMKHARVRGELWGATPEERYRCYTEDVLPSKREDLLSRYPVLARLLAVVSISFERCATEFLDRFQADRVELGELLGAQRELLIEHVTPFLSDPHNGGQTVWRAVFTEDGKGFTAYYKPRSLAVDVAWADLLAWMTDHGLQPDLAAAAVLDRGEYGWARGVEASDCKNEEEVALYVRRQGALSALFVALAGQDFHPENFIAAGSMPIAVDLEGLLSAMISTRIDTLAGLPHTTIPLVFTAAGNLMLPYFRAGEPDQPLFFASGIMGTGTRVWPVKSPRWVNQNTDQLSLSMQWVELHYENSVPTLNGRKVNVEPYRQQVVDGMVQAFKVLEEHWATLLAEGGPLGAFRGLGSRTVFRDTQEYIDLLFWTTAPDILRSGAAFEVAAEVFAARPPVFCNGAEFPSLIEKEKEGLWRRDIPIAFTPNDRTSMVLEDGTEFGPTLPMSAWEQLSKRAEDWTSTETAWQAGIARAMLSFTEERAPLPTDDLLAAATAIGDLLLDTAVSFEDEVAWITLIRGANSQRVYPFQTNAWDGNGTAGVALFLAELGRVTGEQRFSDMARRAFASIERTLRSLRKSEWTTSVGLSGFHGIFALVYALTRAGVALGDTSLLDLAVTLSVEIREEELRAEDVPDFLLGHAGALAALAELYRWRPDERLRTQAQICAEIITAAACKEGQEGWKVRHFDRPLLGMGHGSSGIAASFLLAENILGQDAMPILRAALEHERTHFDADKKRWPNLQRSDGHTMHGWCSGQAGIGMARLLALRLAGARLNGERTQVEAELETAIASAVEELHTARQHACCGDAGVIFLLSTAGRALNRPELLAQARQAAHAMLERARDQRAWRLQEYTERLPIPGLLNGISGIGLTLLTVLDPNTSEFLTLC